ncbi:hypothetical protein CEXT_743291 [Caerostris extrusa]|uniref:Uncharacterized protein n=1 Tax=Caerostris extrusa TaxID=172846 RepID=A0AAV4VVA5_CAEEX|nr:hypothetical protein CEXT_743291 [Caerostris extrusa]
MFVGGNDDGLWRQRNNFELYKVFKEADIIKFIFMRFVGRICQIDTSSLTFGIFNYIPFGTRTKDRPKLKWTDCVEAVFRVLRVTN